MGRRPTQLIVLCAVVAAGLPGGASGTGAADSFVGSWEVVTRAVTGAPWDIGRHGIKITLTSQAAALGAMSASAPYRDGSTLFCGATPQNPKDHPGATWYRLGYTWSGKGALYSCATGPGGLTFVGGSRTLDLTPFPGPKLLGTWHGTWGDHSTDHNIELKPYTGGSGGGGGGTTAPAGAVKTVTEPAPGASAVTTSPKPLPAGCGTRAPSSGGAGMACDVAVSVTTSAGNLGGTTIVGEGERTGTQAAGEAVAACWLIGPDALDLSAKGKETYAKNKDKFAAFSPQQQLRFCMALVTAIGVFGPRKETRKPAEAVAGCRVARLSVSFENGHVVAVQPAPKLTASAVRYRCANVAGGLKLTATGPLQKAIGPKLDLGIVRSAKAPKRSAKLKLAYSW